MSRDLRDPKIVGGVLETLRATKDYEGIHYPFHVLADMLPGIPIADYPQDESMATVTAREYREELRLRAEQGDKYAESMLNGLPWDEPVDA